MRACELRTTNLDGRTPNHGGLVVIRPEIDTGLDLDLRGPAQIPLRDMDDLANYLAMQRIRVSAPLYTQLQRLRSARPRPESLEPRIEYKESAS